MHTFRNKAYSVIEIIIGMAIIVMLAGLLCASLRASRARSHVASCANNLRQLGMGLEMFADDHDGRYPRDPKNTDDLSPLYPHYVDDLSVFMCPAAQARLPRSEYVSSPQHLSRSRQDEVIGIDYEYRGEQFPLHQTPSWNHAGKKPTTYVLLYDNDNRGTPSRIDAADNHGARGGNKLFSDGSVRWYRADMWAYPLEDGTDIPGR